MAGGAEDAGLGGKPHLVGPFQDGDQGGQPGFEYLHAALGPALNHQLALVRVHGFDLAHIGEQLHAKPLGDAGADLGGVAVDGLLAAKHQIDRHVAVDLSDGCRQGKAGGQGVGAGKRPVGYQNGIVGAEGNRLAQGRFRLGRSHAQHRDMAAVGILHPQRLFQSKQVIGVDDGRHALAHDGVGHRVHADLRAVRHLFDTDDNVHGHYPL